MYVFICKGNINYGVPMFAVITACSYDNIPGKNKEFNLSTELYVLWLSED